MKCKKCGNKVNNEDKICSKCGSELEKKESSRKNKVIAIFIVAIIAIIAIVSVVFVVSNKDNDVNNNEEEHVTKREQCIADAITALEDYRDDKISGEETVTKLREIADEAKKESEKEEEKRGEATYKSLKWSSLYLDVEFMATNIETVNLIKIEKYNKLDENKISEYIDTLRKELE